MGNGLQAAVPESERLFRQVKDILRQLAERFPRLHKGGMALLPSRLVAVYGSGAPDAANLLVSKSSSRPAAEVSLLLDKLFEPGAATAAIIDAYVRGIPPFAKAKPLTDPSADQGNAGV